MIAVLPNMPLHTHAFGAGELSRWASSTQRFNC